MASETTADAIGPDTTEFRIRRIGTRDVFDALARGLSDFKEKPSHVIFLCVIYPVIALILSRLTFGYAMVPLLYPLIAGFALVGPVAAIGLYELSRRREQGLDVSWQHAFGVIRTPAIRGVVSLALVLAALFLAWLASAMAIYQATVGSMPESVAAFVRTLFTTPEGWTLIVAGNAVGALFAVVVLTISFVSFPMLIDRHVSAARAVLTSIKAAAANPGPTALWGAIVAVGLAVGSLPFFIGLAVVIPVLGHATWHLYRKVVEP